LIIYWKKVVKRIAEMKIQIKITLNNELFIRDPEQTKLGQEMVSQSIILIHKLGFEKFTFKKLAEEINSNEQSIYRYFNNKHQLLRYLISWYWAWIEYQIDLKINYINEPLEKLKAVIRVLSDSAKNDPNFEHIDQSVLAHIVIKTSPISYITEELTKEERDSILQSFKSLCNKIAEIIKSCSPRYTTPNALATTMIRMTREQIFFSKYFSDLTELDSTPEDTSEIYTFVEKNIFAILKKLS
jgi:AcrR family transcriptional regulator